MLSPHANYREGCACVSRVAHPWWKLHIKRQQVSGIMGIPLGFSSRSRCTGLACVHSRISDAHTQEKAVLEIQRGLMGAKLSTMPWHEMKGTRRLTVPLGPSWCLCVNTAYGYLTLPSKSVCNIPPKHTSRLIYLFIIYTISGVITSLC